jgi:hypothetical protein
VNRHNIAGAQKRNIGMKTIGSMLFTVKLLGAVFEGYNNSGQGKIIHEQPEQKIDTPKADSMNSLVWIGMVLLGVIVLIRSHHRSKINTAHKGQ